MTRDKLLGVLSLTAGWRPGGRIHDRMGYNCMPGARHERELGNIVNQALHPCV